jgi:hypothetical protein
VKNLCSFLLRNTVGAASEEGGSVRVRTELVGDNLVLRIETTVAKGTLEGLAQLFDPHAVSRLGMSNLELAACQALARRLGGNLSATWEAETGLILRLSLPSRSHSPPSKPEAEL